MMGTEHLGILVQSWNGSCLSTLKIVVPFCLLSQCVGLVSGLLLFNPGIVTLIILIWDISPQLSYELLKGRDPVYLKTLLILHLSNSVNIYLQAQILAPLISVDLGDSVSSAKVRVIKAILRPVKYS